MSLFGSPTSQWKEAKEAAVKVSRLVPVLDGSGFWVLLEGAAPSGAFVADASGFTIIDDTTIVGLKVALAPIGYTLIY